jgi:Family of unknown function (DUF6194)
VEDIAGLIAELPGVVTVTASEQNGAPEVAWGDSFFFYDPQDAIPPERRFPFATIVTQDYPGFDTDSDLDRAGVYRLNLSVGRDRFTQLFGFPPADFPAHRAEFDYSVLDRLIPHPAYGKQAWISILVPGGGTRDQLLELITEAHARARSRYAAS